MRIPTKWTMAASTALVLATTVAGALPAQAAPIKRCISNEWGQLCLAADPAGYQISLTAYVDPNDGSPNPSLDFRLVCSNGKWFGDAGGWKWEAFRVRSYVFSVGQQGQCAGMIVEWGTKVKPTATLKTPYVGNPEHDEP